MKISLYNAAYTSRSCCTFSTSNKRRHFAQMPRAGSGPLAKFEQFYNFQIRSQSPNIIARFRNNLSHFKCAISRAKMPGVAPSYTPRIASSWRRRQVKE